MEAADSQVLQRCADHTLTVMTYNLGNELARAEAVARLVRALAPDVVGLQEVASGQASVLQRELAALYPYQAVYAGGFAGKAVFSRYAIVGEARLELYPARPDLQVVLSVGGRALTLLVAHPPPPRMRRHGLVFDAGAVHHLRGVATLAAGSAPAVLVGDFNMTPRHAAYAFFRRVGLRDAFGDVGCGRGATLPARLGPSRWLRRPPGWPRLVPVVRVDYIWHTRELRAEAAWVGADAGSDHLPVLARLALDDDPR
jgi:vancomycin resistance protein VanJ